MISLLLLSHYRDHVIMRGAPGNNCGTSCCTQNTNTDTLYVLDSESLAGRSPVFTFWRRPGPQLKRKISGLYFDEPSVSLKPLDQWVHSAQLRWLSRVGIGIGRFKLVVVDHWDLIIVTITIQLAIAFRIPTNNQFYYGTQPIAMNTLHQNRLHQKIIH